MLRLIDSLMTLRSTRTANVRRVLQNRFVLFGILLFVQFQFFTINMLNAKLRAPTDGWELIIPAIDNHLTPNGLWLIPYSIGFIFAPLVPLWAVFNMPNTEFRQFISGMMFAALVGYVIYILVPTYVTKPAPESVPGSGFFADTLRRSYAIDAEASTHNAAPSQHVFYAILNACFVIRFRPRALTFWFWTILASLISASALLTMRHNSPDIIAGYVTAVVAYYVGVWLGARITQALGDANAPVPSLRLPWGWRITTRRRSTPRDLDVRVS